MIPKSILNRLYTQERKSMQDIAKILHCSLGQVSYWMDQYTLRRRTISEAVYLQNNPDGDPFKVRRPKNIEEAILFGLGFGLYWGEGTKANLDSVRLGNTDPALIGRFIDFLVTFFSVDRSDFRFSLQLFTDISIPEALRFWLKRLRVSKRQFYSVTVTPSGFLGTYRKKSKYGVLTVYYHNKKLRNILVHMLASVTLPK